MGLEEEMRKMGIPVAQISASGENQFRFYFEPLDFSSPEALLTYADAFHTAKWLIKHLASANGYYSTFQPLTEAGTTHDLTISVPGLPIHRQHLLSHLPLFYPSLNSTRSFL